MAAPPTSTSRYPRGILAPHDLHPPERANHETIGISSRAVSSLPQLSHLERSPPHHERSSTVLEATTFRKDPCNAPRRAEKTIKMEEKGYGHYPHHSLPRRMNSTKKGPA